jgi:glycosyltransferase involved in cell wall biosynthesis
MLVANGVRRDPRVTKEARALARAGYSVGVVGYTLDRYMEMRPVRWEDSGDGYRICLVPLDDIAGQYEHLHMAYFALDLLGARDLPHNPLVAKGTRRTVKAFRRIGRALGLGGAAAGALEAPNGEPSDPRLALQHSALMSGVQAHRAYNQRLAIAALTARPRVVHAHDLDILEAGVWASRATGAALVFDAHEIWWQQHAEGEAPRAWIEFYRNLEATLIHRVDRVVTVSDSIADFFANTHAIERPIVVRNSIELPAGGFIPPEKLHAPHTPVEVLYHGGLSRDRGLEELIEAAASFENAVLVVRGSGQLEGELKARVADRGIWNRVRFEPPVPMNDVVLAASSSDIGVIPYKPVCLNNRCAMPNKLFEYLAAGLAIAASDLPEIRRVVEKARVGAVLDPRSPASIAEAVNRLAADRLELSRMRSRALEAASTSYNWDLDAQALVELYRTLLPRGWKQSLVRAMTGRPRSPTGSPGVDPSCAR